MLCFARSDVYYWLICVPSTFRPSGMKASEEIETDSFLLALEGGVVALDQNDKRREEEIQLDLPCARQW